VDVTTKGSFDPSRYLTKVKGNDYLEAKWRIAWFRDVYPAGTISTELLRMEGSWAVVRAEVRAIDADGTFHGSATGMAMDDAGKFEAFLEKCETAAVARALAMLGFGTQFAMELDDSGRIADAPVQHGNLERQPTPFRGNQPQGQRNIQNPDAPASDKQVSMIYGKAKALRWSNDALFDYLAERFNAPNPFGPEELRKGDASAVIDDLQARLEGSR